MKILGHRGYSGKYPENTMTAFKKAYEVGADGIELDVQFTKDGEIVIIHDETIDRTTNGTGDVRSYTLKELQSFNAATINDTNCKEEYIPTLDEYLNWVKDTGMITNIELKTGRYYYQGIEEGTLALVKKYGLEDKIIFSSFNPLSVYKIKQLAPDIPCGLLTEFGGIENAGALCKDFGFEYYHPCWKDITESNLASLKANGIDLNVWTVNDFDSFLKMYEIGVNSIITNFPEVAVNYFKGKEK